MELFNKQLFFEYYARFRASTGKIAAIQATGLSAASIYRLDCGREDAVTVATVEKVAAAMNVRPHIFINRPQGDATIDEIVVLLRTALVAAGYSEKSVSRVAKSVNNSLYAIGYPVAWED